MIPVVLFVYNRPDALLKTLEGLRANSIPKLIVYSDGAKRLADRSAVKEVRKIVSAIDWCEVRYIFREGNYGLGRNILSGVTETLSSYESCIVFEDDLVSVPGTYMWMCAALERYKDDPNVYSVTGWTNKKITPQGLNGAPFFNGRADSLAWGTWRRAWIGMTEETATQKLCRAMDAGIDPYRFGGDLPYTARIEMKSNLWAVRFCYHHIVNHGLALHPPWSLVNHIGWGDDATNETARSWIENGILRSAPAIPNVWPEAIEFPGSDRLLRKAYPRPWVDRFPRLVMFAKMVLAVFNRR